MLAAIQKNKKGDLSLPTVNYFCIAMKKQLTEAQRYEIYLGLNFFERIRAKYG